MSIPTLEKAIYYYLECMDLDNRDYIDTRNKDIMFLYDMIENQGESATLQFLIDNEYI